jgi:hypothetical protein
VRVCPQADEKRKALKFATEQLADAKGKLKK